MGFSFYAGGGADLIPERDGPLVLPLLRAGLTIYPAVVVKALASLGRRRNPPAETFPPEPVRAEPVAVEPAVPEPALIEPLAAELPPAEPVVAELIPAEPVPVEPVLLPEETLPEILQEIPPEPELLPEPVIEPVFEPVPEPAAAEPVSEEHVELVEEIPPEPVEEEPVLEEPPAVEPLVEEPVIVELPPVFVEEPVVTEPVPLRILSTVSFSPDTATPQGHSALDTAGALLAAFPRSVITIRGYAAPFSSAEGQQTVSRNRALYCRDYLEQNYSIPVSRIITAWYGAEQEPETYNHSDESRRSAELVIELAGREPEQPWRTLSTVYFSPDTAVPQDHSALDAAGALLAAFPRSVITIRGYAAPFASAEGQQTVSRNRALYCRDYLEQNYNIPASRIITAWYGAEQEPETYNHSDESRRSAELVIEGEAL
jgi:outer membrane protein OmpA-like peptidoglycan-associated protein